MNKTIVAAIAILFLANASVALWTEHLIAYAYDKENRPVPGAEIEVKYQKERFPVTTATFDGTLTGKTNEDGAFQATFYNQVYAEDYTIREYVVFAKYMGKFNSIAVTCRSMERLNCSSQQPNALAITLPVYRANVQATDQDGRPLKDVVAITSGMQKQTDASGKTFFPLPEKQSYEITAMYGGLKEKRTVTLNADANVTIVMPLYDVVLKITDENGNALEALVTLGNESKQTMGMREVAFNRIAYKNATLTIEARGETKKYQIILDEDITQEIIFDGTPPRIDEVEITETPEAKLEVTARVADEGEKAAGLKGTEPATANYSTGGAWSTTRMYPLGNGRFKTTLEKPAPGETIRVKITAEDNEGNVGTSQEATFRTKRTGEEDEEEKPASGGGGGIDYVLILGGIIVIVIIALVAKKIKEEFMS